jgi:DNA topoisomerase-1
MPAVMKLVRRPSGRGFVYFDSGGRRVSDAKVIKYVKALAVPPAWRDVRVTVSERARILATGYDKAGRKQYIYNPSFRARQEKAKFDRLLAFAEALPHMRRVTGQQESPAKRA